MLKLTILNKLKLFNIHNLWQISIVHELSNRRGASANIEPLFRSTQKRMKAMKEPKAHLDFKTAMNRLIELELIYEKASIRGTRLHLLMPVWQLDDAILEGVKSATTAIAQGRRININWLTILKEVRKELSSHDIKLQHKITRTLVRFFLRRHCKWKLQQDGSLLAPKSISKKIPKSKEQQQDMFAEL